MILDLTLVLPCYNDGELLEASLREIQHTLSQTRYTYEIILIDDCSPDGSAETVRRIAAKHDTIRSICHPTNIGRGGTVVEGMLAADGRVVGFIDVDLEVHCRYIPAMVGSIEQGYDGATAHRIYRLQWVPSMVFRAFLSVAYRKLVRYLLQLPYQDTETGYKFFAKEKIAPILKQCQSQGWFWDTEVMALAHYHGLTITEIPCLFIRRWDKESTVKPIRDSIDYLREILHFRKRAKQEQLL